MLVNSSDFFLLKHRQVHFIIADANIFDAEYSALITLCSRWTKTNLSVLLAVPVLVILSEMR